MTQSPKKTGFLAITYNLSAMLSPGGLPCVAVISTGHTHSVVKVLLHCGFER